MQVDLEMCAKLGHEGIGSLYERVVLREFLTRLVSDREIGSVLEYDCRVTKGYDNVVLLPHADVTVGIDSPGEAEQAWPFPDKPRIKCLHDVRPHDLVWSFAIAQMEPDIVDRMREASNKWVLVFVPNALNWGAPWHWLLHVVTRAPCTHAERRLSLSLGTLAGMRRLFSSAGVTPAQWGYIDMPWLPDIGFSKRELRKVLNLGGSTNGGAESPEQLAAGVENTLNFEHTRALGPLRAFVAHHLYVLGRVD